MEERGLARAPQNDWIKWIAMATMLIDHMGVLLFPQQIWMRSIGRIAFPIFAYGIARGVTFSRDRKSYLLRLFFIGIISQIPYMWLNYGAEFKPFEINQVPQLLYAAILLLILDDFFRQGGWKKALGLAVVIPLSLLPELAEAYWPQFGFAYSTYGIWMSIIFWLFQERWGLLLLSYLGLSLLEPYLSVTRYLVNRQGMSYWQAITNFSQNCEIIWQNSHLLSLGGLFFQARSLMALPILWWSERRKTPYKINPWIVYWFYPLHIAVLVVLHFLLLR